jgi:hypothetical protein
MDLAFWFQVFSNAAVLGWLLLLIAPDWVVTRAMVRSGILPLLLCVAYAVLIAPLLSLELFRGFGSLDGVMKLFTDPRLVLAGWVHYLAFDLWLGAWIVSDSRARRIAHWKILPVLPFTFMLGPVGVLMYMLILRRRPLDTDAAKKEKA